MEAAEARSKAAAEEVQRAELRAEMGRLSSSLESAMATQQRQLREAKVKERVLLEAQHSRRSGRPRSRCNSRRPTSFGDQGRWAKQAEAEAERRAQAEAASRAALAEAAAGAEQAEEFFFLRLRGRRRRRQR